MIALDLMGAKELSDAELADADRALTPAEQKRVDAYQIRLAEGTLEEVRKDAPADAPRVTMEVSREGAVLTATPPAPKPATRWWVWASVAAACAVLAALAAGALRRAPR